MDFVALVDCQVKLKKSKTTIVKHEKDSDTNHSRLWNNLEKR